MLGSMWNPGSITSSLSEDPSSAPMLEFDDGLADSSVVVGEDCGGIDGCEAESGFGEVGFKVIGDGVTVTAGVVIGGSRMILLTR